MILIKEEEKHEKNDVFTVVACNDFVCSRHDYRRRGRSDNLV